MSRGPPKQEQGFLHVSRSDTIGGVNGRECLLQIRILGTLSFGIGGSDLLVTTGVLCVASASCFVLVVNFDDL